MVREYRCNHHVRCNGRDFQEGDIVREGTDIPEGFPDEAPEAFELLSRPEPVKEEIPAPSIAQVRRMNLAPLEGLAESMDLPGSGTKKELIQRIVGVLEAGEPAEGAEQENGRGDEGDADAPDEDQDGDEGTFDGDGENDEDDDSGAEGAEQEE